VSARDENFVIATLSEDAYWNVNKAIGRAHGIEHAALIAELIYKFKYWRERGQLDNARGFFYTSADIQKVLGVSERAAKRLTKSVQGTGFVKVKKRGQPAKNYWYLQFQAIADFLSQAETVPTGQDETVLSSECETVPAITKKTDKENNTSSGGWSLADKGLKPTKTPKEPKAKKARDFSAIEPVLAILHSEDPNAHKAISLNTQKMIEHEIEEHGVDYVCNAVRGRMYAVKGTGKPLMLTAFFDPDRAEWRADMAKHGEQLRMASERLKMASQRISQPVIEYLEGEYIENPWQTSKN
jgi:hypothetical protein